MSLAVWAEQYDAAGIICEDARLREGSELSDRTYGQAGWDMGLRFGRLHELASKLKEHPVFVPRHVCGNWLLNCGPIQEGQISRLALCVHGDPGILYVNSKNEPGLTIENYTDRAAFGTDLENIGRMTSTEAVILFMSCDAGAGEPGTMLLKAFSTVWKGRTVVGFSTLGGIWAVGMKRRGAGVCNEAGMRDTPWTAHTPDLDQKLKEQWTDLKSLPWATEMSPHAKCALNGHIIRSPDTERKRG